MKALFTCLTLMFSLSVQAVTVDDLVKSHGKRAIMDAIRSELGNRFTVVVNNSKRNALSPSPEYVSSETLTADIMRAGMTPASVEVEILKTLEFEENRKRQFQEQPDNHDKVIYWSSTRAREEEIELRNSKREQAAKSKEETEALATKERANDDKKDLSNAEAMERCASIKFLAEKVGQQLANGTSVDQLIRNANGDATIINLIRYVADNRRLKTNYEIGVHLFDQCLLLREAGFF